LTAIAANAHAMLDRFCVHTFRSAQAMRGIAEAEIAARKGMSQYSRVANAQAVLDSPCIVNS